jgi:hypothetical protein
MRLAWLQSLSGRAFQVRKRNSGSAIAGLFEVLRPDRGFLNFISKYEHSTLNIQRPMINYRKQYYFLPEH